MLSYAVFAVIITHFLGMASHLILKHDCWGLCSSSHRSTKGVALIRRGVQLSFQFISEVLSGVEIGLLCGQTTSS